MSFEIRLATSEDIDSAENLFRANMSRFYLIYHRKWETQKFRSSWPRTENYLEVNSSGRIGRLRIEVREDELDISDLQIVPKWQGLGAWTFAIRFAGKNPRIANCRVLDVPFL